MIRRYINLLNNNNNNNNNNSLGRVALVSLNIACRNVETFAKSKVKTPGHVHHYRRALPEVLHFCADLLTSTVCVIVRGGPISPILECEK